MLDWDELESRGIEALVDALAEDRGQHWLPVSFKVNEVRFFIYTYMQLIDGSEPDGLTFNRIGNVDPYSSSHMDAVQIAFWIYSQIDAISNTIMFCGKGHVDTSIAGETSEKLKRYMGHIQDLKLLDIYPYLPEIRKDEIDESILTCKHAYEDALRREAAERNRLWWEAFRNNPKHGYIYLLQSVSGAYKIGRSKDPDDRLRTFEVKLPFEVEYVCTVETANMYELERALHKQFDHKRINGEWFRLDDKDIAAIKALSEIKPPAGVQLW